MPPLRQLPRNTAYMIKILAIGRKHESWIADGLERYQKRLKAPWNVEWVTFAA